MFFVSDKKLKIEKPIRLIELFAGVGAQAKAFENINADFEHYFVCEFDEKAVRSYNAIHHTEFSTCDVTKIKASDLNIVDVDNYVYLLTYSFPCTDISTAGKMLGMQKGSGTRSSLLWEVKRLLTECDNLPQILLMENVTQVHLNKNRESFGRWCEFLSGLGYTNYMNDLCASDYDVPQTRVRTFMISVLGDLRYDFPNKLNLSKKFTDLLQTCVDVRHYILSDFGRFVVNRFLADKYLPDFSNSSENEKLLSEYIYISDNDIDAVVKRSCVLCGQISKDMKVQKTDENITKQRFRLKKAQILGTLTTVEKDNVIFEAYEICSEMSQKFKDYFRDCFYTFNDKTYLCLLRYLTPRECFRFMGFGDEDFDNVEKLNLSDDCLYKQSGNSIVVDVLMKIFESML